jgi:hypothetical protein
MIVLTLLTIAGKSRADLSDDELNQLANLCRPSHQELAWRSLPWMTDLWQARELAARVGKPILLWEMDGHPLGCT